MKQFTLIAALLMLSACGPSAVFEKDGIPGKDGADGVNGTNGSNGSNGTDGQDGLNGLNGADGTQIGVVVFCPGYAPVYPTVFPEVGMCINDKLYAVYSANGGFLAPIPEGRYSSNAIGSACTFNVGPHCTITW